MKPTLPTDDAPTLLPNRTSVDAGKEAQEPLMLCSKQLGLLPPPGELTHWKNGFAGSRWFAPNSNLRPNDLSGSD